MVVAASNYVILFMTHDAITLIYRCPLNQNVWVTVSWLSMWFGFVVSVVLVLFITDLSSVCK